MFDRSDIHHTRRGVPVRAVEYTIAGHEGAYRLITTILDPNKAPAAELAALYAQRWEFESTLDEIKTRLGGPHLVLRSQHPDGAEQELYGFLLVPPRHPAPDAPGRTTSRPGPRPDLLHPLTARRAPSGHRPGGISPRPTRPRGQSHPC
ncbi:transposase [Streptomyces sp. NPDC059837]|uniref:transposase n=1 Tax=unclassified Streptomyces TaxID=2593676 RepID=UPI00364B59BF